MMPSERGRATCLNCGHRRLKLKKGVPPPQPTVKFGQSNPDSPWSSLAFTLLILLCGAIFFAMGIFMRSPLGVLWGLLGALGISVAIYCLRDLIRTCQWGRKPEKGYIAHLKELADEREIVMSRIKELEKLLGRQRPDRSERAANRTKLLNAALDNRKTRLSLIYEAAFIIESKRRISRIEALAQDLARKANPRETEKHLDTAFTDLKSWIAEQPVDCLSQTGRRVQETLRHSAELHKEIREQIEDRLVMRALDDDPEPDVAEILARIDSFLDQSLLRDNQSVSEIVEAMASDEEFIKINTELRLWKDGIKHNSSDTAVSEQEI